MQLPKQHLVPHLIKRFLEVNEDNRAIGLGRVAVRGVKKGVQPVQLISAAELGTEAGLIDNGLLGLLVYQEVISFGFLWNEYFYIVISRDWRYT